jgi:hypothetical protein
VKALAGRAARTAPFLVVESWPPAPSGFGGPAKRGHAEKGGKAASTLITIDGRLIGALGTGVATREFSSQTSP